MTEAIQNQAEDSPDDLLQRDESQRADGIYDFIYRDTNRIWSYYAQIFRGRVSVTEEISQQKTLRETTGGLKLAVTAQYKKQSEDGSSSKDVIDPHDSQLLDLLEYFAKNNWIVGIDEAIHGNLVRATGTVLFFDQVLLDAAINAMKHSMVEQRKKAKTPADKAEFHATELGVKMFEKMTIPPMFYFHSTDGHRLVGTIKEVGLEEPVSTYYFRHGQHGLAGVTIIGILEKSTASNISQERLNDFVQGTNAISNALSTLVFNTSDIRITPLMMYRQL